MAQGYIGQKANMEMETIAEGYFDYLATRSFFQDFGRDEEGIVESCKMHDIVHDFAQYLTRNECAAIEVDDDEKPLSLTNTCQEKLRHSTLVLGYQAPRFPVSIFNAKKLRSLILLIESPELEPMSVLQGLFDQLTCLRTLKIEERWIGRPNEIVKGLENLIHLRYLQLHTGVEELPETCCELLNLQTLDCPSLTRLPQGIGKLINLRHLNFDEDSLAYVPNGIERLTNLRTLVGFAVARVGGKYSNKACNLEGLRHLNHLRGFLQISGLGNVTDVDEAKNAHLEKKKNLVHLVLVFNTLEEEDGEEATEEMNEEDEAKHEAVCGALRPPPDVESLEIRSFKGRTPSNWIVSLNKLKMLTLKYFPKCEIMPPLGKLPSLETLEIRSMESVKRVGDEFLGIFMRFLLSKKVSEKARERTGRRSLTFQTSTYEEALLIKYLSLMLPEVCSLPIVSGNWSLGQCFAHASRQIL